LQGANKCFATVIFTSFNVMNVEYVINTDQIVP
jgi:hypothetical protein